MNLGMRDPDDLRWWGVNVDTINSHTKEAAAPIKTQWLPHYLHVHVSGNDSNSDSNSNDVTVTQSLADDLDQLETCDGGGAGTVCEEADRAEQRGGAGDKATHRRT